MYESVACKCLLNQMKWSFWYGFDFFFGLWHLTYWRDSKCILIYKYFGTVISIVISELLFGIAAINECLPGVCVNNGTCIDLVNAYRCDCGSGFNGTNCEISTYCISFWVFPKNGRHQSLNFCMRLWNKLSGLIWMWYRCVSQSFKLYWKSGGCVVRLE